jgi:sterol desaturase/sphingolipid hydroxylase (fatty acid hydroxylase superfamily)
MSLGPILIVLGQVFFETARTVAVLWLLAGAVWMIYNGPFRDRFARRRIQGPRRGGRLLRHELAQSTLNILGTTIAGLGTAWLISAGYAHIDDDPHHWPQGLVHFAIYFVAFDLYFYGMHRLLHTSLLYRWVHRYHHVSDVPGPLTAFSFHPIEGIVSNAFVTLMMLALDLNIVGLALIYAYGVLNSLLVHGGFEVFPAGWYRSRWTSWYLTPVFHDVHHSREDGNYGGFMTIWDRVFRTVSPASTHLFEAAGTTPPSTLVADARPNG